MAIPIGRRKFIITLSGVAASWPIAGRAQQSANIKERRIGFLFAGTIAERPQAQEFWRTLERLGYVEGKNLKGTSNNTGFSAISALAERAVAALVPKGVSDRRAV